MILHASALVHVDVLVASDTHELIQPTGDAEAWPYQVADLGPFPVLDATATWSPGSTVTAVAPAATAAFNIWPPHCSAPLSVRT